MNEPMASPLTWPAGQRRTPAMNRRRNPLWRRASVNTACVQIQNEVERLGGHDLVVSTNLALRIDGFPRSGQGEPADPGVAVYFTREGKALVFACDRYKTVSENLRAVGMHLDAMRGIERWGVGTLDQAFAGYAALPETAGEDPWWKILGLVDPCQTTDELLTAYRTAAHIAHPDRGGSHNEFVRVHKAYLQGKEALRK